MIHDDDLNVREELRAARSTPTEEFASRLFDRIRAEQPRRRPRVSVGSYRPALALAATLSALVVAGAFGGISEAARTVEGAVSSIVHIGHASKLHHAVRPNAALHKASATPSSHGAINSAGQSNGGITAPPPHLAPPPNLVPPGSPADSQYQNPCHPHFRGPYITCKQPLG